MMMTMVCWVICDAIYCDVIKGASRTTHRGVTFERNHGNTSQIIRMERKKRIREWNRVKLNIFPGTLSFFQGNSFLILFSENVKYQEASQCRTRLSIDQSRPRPILEIFQRVLTTSPGSWTPILRNLFSLFLLQWNKTKLIQWPLDLNSIKINLFWFCLNALAIEASFPDLSGVWSNLQCSPDSQLLVGWGGRHHI